MTQGQHALVGRRARPIAIGSAPSLNLIVDDAERPMSRTFRMHWILVAGMALAACTGRIFDAPEPVGQVGSAQCTGLQPGKSPIRRMTRFEYNNTVRDLLGDDTMPASSFAPEEEAMGFNNQATALGVTELLAEQFLQASEDVAGRAAQHMDTLLPCKPAEIGEEACARQFITTFGKRAYRRPLEASETDKLFSLYQWGRNKYDFSNGIQLVIQATLQSPWFLYRVEFGMPDPTEGNIVELNPYEIASRLSFLIWGSMPDDELFRAADANELSTTEQIASQARRMLDDPRARPAIANFHEQWLGLGTLETINKDQSTYPEYTPSLRALWKEETLAYLDHVIFDEGGDVKRMFTAPYSMMNAELASFYGVDNGPKTDAFERVDLDPQKHAGFITQASVLAFNAKPDQSSPVHRGKFVRERLLCQLLPPPPNNAVIVAPNVDPNSTTRERFSEHSTNPACSVCHKLMDPIGFGFEHYDGIGRWRDTDQGFAIDSSGEIQGSRDADGTFDGAADLAVKLGESEQVRQCVATQWFRFGYGRAEQEEDQCAMNQLQDAFKAAGYNVKELIVALTQTDAFRYRRAVVAGK